MKVIILAGGKATRLPRSAKDIPKALVEVGGKPILQHQLDWLEKHGIKDIRLALGFAAEQIINYLGSKHEYVVEPEPFGTGGAIKFASQGLKEPFLVLNGDIITDLNLSEFIETFRSSGFPNMMAVYEVQNAGDFGLVTFVSNRATDFLEKPDAVFLKNTQNKFINAGVYVLSPESFEGIRGKSFSIEKDVFPKLTAEGKLAVFPYRGFWQEMGTEERLRAARNFFNL